MDYLIGHLVGDYLLQSSDMAKFKKYQGHMGVLFCMAHCLLWSFSVCLFTGWWNPGIFGIVFLSHWSLDRTNFVKWLLPVLGKDTDLWIVYICDNTLHLTMLWLIDKFVVRWF
jgi:hypothetical protein